MGNPVNDALRFIGVPYLWGGTTPSGFDCSGLIQYVYGLSGIQLPRTSYEQIRVGSNVPVGPPGHELQYAQPGDAVFFNNADHEGMVYDPSLNKMIDAPHTGALVRIDSVTGFGNITGIRRFTNASTNSVDNSSSSNVNIAQNITADTCAVPFLFGSCLLKQTQLRGVYGGALMLGGSIVSVLGIWLLIGHPGSKEIGLAAKVAVL